MIKPRKVIAWIKKHGLNIFAVLFLIGFAIAVAVAIMNPIYN